MTLNLLKHVGKGIFRYFCAIPLRVEGDDCPSV